MDGSPIFYFGEEKMIIEKKIRALKDLDLKTPLGFRSLVGGEVVVFPFKNSGELEALLSLGNIELVVDEEEVKREIPVVRRDSTIPTENELLKNLQLTGNLAKLNKIPASEEKKRKVSTVEIKESESVVEETRSSETRTEGTDKNQKEIWNSNEGSIGNVNRS